jgi:group I intron endonuclease
MGELSLNWKNLLKYCSPEALLERETYYIFLLKAEYNILQEAGSRMGFKHYSETKAKMSEASPSAGFSPTPSLLSFIIREKPRGGGERGNTRDASSIKIYIFFNCARATLKKVIKIV